VLCDDAKCCVMMSSVVWWCQVLCSDTKYWVVMSSVVCCQQRKARQESSRALPSTHRCLTCTLPAPTRDQVLKACVTCTRTCFTYYIVSL